MSSTGPGAPPWSGPFSAESPASTDDPSPARVDATTRAANVDALSPWSLTVTRYASSAAARSASGAPRSMRTTSSA